MKIGLLIPLLLPSARRAKAPSRLKIGLLIPLLLPSARRAKQRRKKAGKKKRGSCSAGGLRCDAEERGPFVLAQGERNAEKRVAVNRREEMLLEKREKRGDPFTWLKQLGKYLENPSPFSLEDQTQNRAVCDGNPLDYEAVEDAARQPLIYVHGVGIPWKAFHALSKNSKAHERNNTDLYFFEYFFSPCCMM